jgi:hypothetical protein
MKAARVSYGCGHTIVTNTPILCSQCMKGRKGNPWKEGEPCPMCQMRNHGAGMCGGDTNGKYRDSVQLH